jgi:hypothetical protein
MQMRGYEPLDAEADGAFRSLFEGFFSDPDADFKTLVENLLPTFEPSMLAYFDRNAQSNPLQDRFFTNLTFIWRRYFDQGRLSEAKAFWNKIVATTRTWEGRTGHRVHKGSALYFWGVTAIVQGEIDKGFLLMHSALEEDILTHNNPLPRTPALMFATLDFSEPRQFFYPFVRELADFLQSFLPAYQTLRGTPFSIDNFRTKFLNHPPSAHAVFALTHALARLHLLHRVPTYSLSSQFGGQYQLAVLSDIALVIDEAVAFKDKAHWRFIDLAAFLASQSNLQLSKDDLAFANVALDASFNTTISALADRTFTFRDGTSRPPLECDLATTYCIRNHGAHNLSSFPAISAEFPKLRQSFLNSLFLTVEILY